MVITPVSYIGVFEDASQMDAFESVCIGCKRYARNCSILARAKEGRIQKEIVDGLCVKYTANKEDKEDGNNEEDNDD